MVGTALLAAMVIPAWAQNIGGYYQVTQRNPNGNVYTGTLALDGSLRGQVTWNNHMPERAFPGQPERQQPALHAQLPRRFGGQLQRQLHPRSRPVGRW